jgi:hypothetical protein
MLAAVVAASLLAAAVNQRKISKTASRLAATANIRWQCSDAPGLSSDRFFVSTSLLACGFLLPRVRIVGNHRRKP